MAPTSVAAAAARGGRPLPSLLVSLATVLVAVTALTSLVPPLLEARSSAAQSTSSSTPPSVSLVGTLSTAGLPDAPVLSRLEVRNDGSTPIRWSLTTEVAGAAPGELHMTAWHASGDRCAAEPSAADTSVPWSSTPLPGGRSTTVCVLITAVQADVGGGRPQATVHARNA